MTDATLPRTGESADLTADPTGRRTSRVRASRLLDLYALASRAASRVRALRAQRKRNQAEQQRLEWVSERREVIASVSHELRTPLTCVVGYSELLLSGDAGPLNRDQRLMLERVADGGERLVDLVEELMRATIECIDQDLAVDMADAVVDVIRGTSPSS